MYLIAFLGKDEEFTQHNFDEIDVAFCATLVEAEDMAKEAQAKIYKLNAVG